MPSDNTSHHDYLSAFEEFLQTGENSKLASFLQGSRPESFLSVYRNGFIRASISALESNFPTLVTLWGEEYFSQIAAAYVNAAPPASATLIGYGFENNPDAPSLSFIEFLQGNAADLIKQYPYVPDICRLDQAWLQALNANGQDFLSLEKVQELIAQGEDLGELPITLNDSAHIVTLEFDLFELWGQLRFGELPDDQAIQLNAHNNAVIFWQREMQVQAKPLSDIEWIFMQNLRQSASMDVASNAALAVDEDFDISTLFAELLNAHLLK